MANDFGRKIGRSDIEPLDTELPVPEAGDTERTLFYGSPCLRGHLFKMLFVLLLSLLVAALPVVFTLFNQGSMVRWWFWLASAVLGVSIFTIWILLLLSTKYRITSYRIDHERGLISKDFRTIELWHVEDVKLTQSLYQRIVQIGTMTVHSNDESDPELKMEHLPFPRPLFTALKQRIIAVKRQRGVLKLDGALQHETPTNSD